MEMDPAKLFQVLDTIDSTNNYAMGQIHAGLAHHGSAWMAREQFAGKGQRGKTWESEPGRNIAISICLNPGAAYHPHPFLFSARLAIICRDFVQTLVPDKVKIKWPNDIYIGDRKAGGLLVENIYQGQSWKWAVAGIGLNINQREFGELSQKAVSIYQMTNQEHDPVTLAKNLHNKLIEGFDPAEPVDPVQIIQVYNHQLFRRSESIRLKVNGQLIEGKLTGVNLSGELMINDGTEKHFRFGEPEWLI